MAKPRVFISSTYYDLKYVRSSLELFIESLGYDPILSEKGDIAYMPDAPLDDSCYREVTNSDIYVLIIGGRYGSEVSSTRSSVPRGFYDRYESITKQEYRAAVAKDSPVYVLVERSVYAEYHTYLRNRNKSDLSYAHVDSVNIFQFVEEILAQPRNNPVQTFERYSEIEAWLREQWAGMFRELLHRTSSQRQLASLSAQVTELAQINNTLKHYLEEVVSKVAPEEAARLIRAESDRLAEARGVAIVSSDPFFSWVTRRFGVDPREFYHALTRSSSFAELVGMVKELAQHGADVLPATKLAQFVQSDDDAQDAIIDIRRMLGLEPFKDRYLERDDRGA